MIGPASALPLMAWGTVVGIDLVSFPQGMLSRPLVAAAVAGAIAGDLGAGLRSASSGLFASTCCPSVPHVPDFGPGACRAPPADSLGRWLASRDAGLLMPCW